MLLFHKSDSDSYIILISRKKAQRINTSYYYFIIIYLIQTGEIGNLEKIILTLIFLAQCIPKLNYLKISNPLKCILLISSTSDNVFDK